LGLVENVLRSLTASEDTATFAAAQGWGRAVSGYVYQTVPVALHAWLSHPRDFRKAVTAVIRCGGDTDTTAAIVGGLIGAAVGPEGIPAEWLSHLAEWPRSVTWMTRVATTLQQALDERQPRRPPGVSGLAVLVRNLF